MKLKDLADALGLSPTTVSRALNGYPEVSEATRERVLEAARRFNYLPNVSARRLATGRAGAVGVVLQSNRSLLLDPHYAEFLADNFAVTFADPVTQDAYAAALVAAIPGADAVDMPAEIDRDGCDPDRLGVYAGLGGREEVFDLLPEDLDRNIRLGPGEQLVEPQLNGLGKFKTGPGYHR